MGAAPLQKPRSIGAPLGLHWGYIGDILEIPTRCFRDVPLNFRNRLRLF